MELGPLDEKSAMTGDGLIPTSVLTWVMWAMGALFFILEKYKKIKYFNSILFVIKDPWHLKFVVTI